MSQEQEIKLFASPIPHTKIPVDKGISVDKGMYG